LPLIAHTSLHNLLQAGEEAKGFLGGLFHRGQDAAEDLKQRADESAADFKRRSERAAADAKRSASETAQAGADKASEVSLSLHVAHALLHWSAPVCVCSVLRSCVMSTGTHSRQLQL
jgi:hypothetical protein